MSSSSESLISEKDISANQEAEHELTDLVLSGESVALVGAGFSRDCGFPNWPELLAKLREQAEELDPTWEFCPGPEFPLEHADSIHQCITDAANEEVFENTLGRILREADQAMELERAGPGVPSESDELTAPDAPPRLQQFHLQLVQLPFRGFLTTNFDHVLEHALERSGRCPDEPSRVRVWNGAPDDVSQAIRGLAVAGSVRHVIHLHGEYGTPSSVVLTSSQYAEAYGLENSQRSRLFHLLVGILMTRRLVFVGFSLKDPYLKKILELVSNLGWEWGEPIHFAVLPRSEDVWPEQRKWADRLKKRFGIQAVFYDARSDDHSELHALINRIYEAYEATKEREMMEPRAPARPGPGMPDWVQKANEAAAEKVGDHEN